MLHFRKPVFFLLGFLGLFYTSSYEVSAQQKWIDETASSVYYLDQVELPTLDNVNLLAKYKSIQDDAQQAIPHTFAEPHQVQMKAENTGQWESSVDGHMLWRQRIVSKGAYSISLGFTEFHLPPSATLFLSDPSRSYVIGPITQADNDAHGEWWSPVIPGDDVVIEVQIAPSQVSDLKLLLTKVNHDFSGLGAVISGSCNVDVLCGAEDGFAIIDQYRDLINAVGMMTIQGRLQCTGSLVNNTRQDCTPYVITAQHCGITNQSSASVVIYWNFQNSQCRAPNSIESGNNGDGNRTQTSSGSRLVAQYDQSDFSLIELDDMVDPSFNPYYLGWNVETESVDTAFAIHHPSGDEKRISFDYDPVMFNVDRNFVRVADWDIGTTEGGSSGGALFNTAGHMIGHLSGGDAACGNDLEDDFGMMKMSWEGGGTPETRLKDWLDPDQTGATTLDGRYCTDVAVLDRSRLSLCTMGNATDTLVLSATAGYEDGAVIRVSESSPGLEISFSSETIRAGESIEIYITAFEVFGSNERSITLIVENDLGPSAFQISVEVFEVAPATPNLVSPEDELSDLNFNVDFEWSNTGASYTLEIAQNPDFISDVRVITTSDNTIALGDFESGTAYFWRVQGINECGASVYSDIRSFSTGSIVCQSEEANDLPASIGDVPVTIISTITVVDEGTIADVNVIDITGMHTFISDLTFTLTSPSGTQVVLVETPCDDENNFNVSFDDDSDIVNLDCPLTTGRTFKPIEPLSAFIGEQASGEWTMTLEDGVGEDGGSFDAWTLELCLNSGNRKRFDASPAFIELCDKDPGDISIDLSFIGDWSNPTNLLITTGSGVAIAASVTPDPIGTSGDASITLDNPSDLVGRSSISVSFEDGDDVVNKDIPVSHVIDVSIPDLLSPNDAETRVELLPTFSWTSGLLDQGTHRITVALDAEFSDILIDTSTASTTLTLSSELEGITTYYWQVTSVGACADLPSEIFSFMTDEKVATIDFSLKSVSIYPSPVHDLLTIRAFDL